MRGLIPISYYKSSVRNNMKQEKHRNPNSKAKQYWHLPVYDERHLLVRLQQHSLPLPSRSSSRGYAFLSFFSLPSSGATGTCYFLLNRFAAHSSSKNKDRNNEFPASWSLKRTTKWIKTIKYIYEGEKIHFQGFVYVVNLCYSPENHSPSHSQIVIDNDTSLGTCRPTQRLKDLK